MQIHFGIGLFQAEWRKSVVCVGTFDGVHLGHQSVICEAVAKAREEELPGVLLTFDRHPAAILAPRRCPKALSALHENLTLFKDLGVSAIIVLAFDAELSRMSAERFLREILIGAARATSIVVGHDFAMGHGREGTAEWLSARIPTTVVPPFQIDGARVSSSAIRRAVAEGKMEYAAKLLGRPYALSGVVVGGQKLGRQLGFPTANVARSFDQTMPSHGVYAGWLSGPSGRYMAAVSIGVRPAVGGRAETVEAYLLDYPGTSLYGASVELELTCRLREEQDFPDLNALTRQIELDVEETRRVLQF